MADKTLYLVANWKSHKTADEAIDWIKAVATSPVPKNVHTIICPPFPYVPQIHGHLSQLKSSLALGVQDVSPFPFGAYTGAVTAGMVKDWASYVIVGHSERRKYFHETHQEVANKIKEINDQGLKAILCVDEPYVLEQFEVLDNTQTAQLIVAYEPLASIGSGDPDTPEHAQNIAERIKSVFKADVPVLYGGSVNPLNIKSFVDQPAISGALVGGASLEPKTWKDLVQAVF